MAFEDRSEGRILYDPHGGKQQEISTLHDRSKGLSVQLPTVRSILRTVGLYQDPQACGGLSQRDGSLHGGVYRRHPSPGRDQGDVEQSYPGLSVPTGGTGVHSEPGEISTSTNSGNRVPGNTSEYSEHGVKTTSKQTEEDLGGGPRHGPRSDCASICQKSIPLTWEDDRSRESHHSGSFILSESPERSGKFPEQQRTGL